MLGVGVGGQAETVALHYAWLMLTEPADLGLVPDFYFIFIFIASTRIDILNSLAEGSAILRGFLTDR